MREKFQVYVSCDVCGDRSYSNRAESLLESVNKAGWRISRGILVCPRCIGTSEPVRENSVVYKATCFTCGVTVIGKDVYLLEGKLEVEGWKYDEPNDRLVCKKCRDMYYFGGE